MADDIVTHCEGSNDTRTPWDNGAVMCAMCGKWFAGDVVPPHDRMESERLRREVAMSEMVRAAEDAGMYDERPSRD